MVKKDGTLFWYRITYTYQVIEKGKAPSRRLHGSGVAKGSTRADALNNWKSEKKKVHPNWKYYASAVKRIRKNDG